MTFTVVWMPRALDLLADIWIRAPDRRGVADAANRIDRTLRVDAHRKGQPLGRGRLLIDDPLAVTFTVDPGDRMVKVLQVRRTVP